MVLRPQEMLYPHSFEDFVFNSISGWYDLTGSEGKKLKRAMRTWTYTQRGDRAEVTHT